MIEDSAKRYERLFKAYNTPESGDTSPALQPGAARTPTKSANRKTLTTKKRKVDQFVDDEQSNAAEDDDENIIAIKKDEPEDSMTVETLGEGSIKTEQECASPAEAQDDFCDTPVEDKIALKNIDEEDNGSV